ncbi:MAG: hypothetical protein GWP35_06525 [Proteobacteria bacterium]|nr:hypothetical protein [Pseudomonadota bacterium]
MPNFTSWYKTILLLVIVLQSTCLATSIFGDEKTPQEPETAAVVKVLFVGNSFTFWNGGLDRHLKILSDSMTPPLGYQTESVVKGGASLEVMWNRTKAVEKINKGNYDIVILQEDIPETTVVSFKEYSNKFIELVRKSGARPILFMAWDYERLNWISMQEIIEAHLEVSKSLKVEVAPVGLAWSLSKKRQPALNMYAKDAEHPSVPGMYLSLIVIEATISGKDPRSRAPKKLPIKNLETLNSEGRKFLRNIAKESILQWKKLLSKKKR